MIASHTFVPGPPPNGYGLCYAKCPCPAMPSNHPCLGRESDHLPPRRIKIRIDRPNGLYRALKINAKGFVILVDGRKVGWRQTMRGAQICAEDFIARYGANRDQQREWDK